MIGRSEENRGGKGEPTTGSLSAGWLVGEEHLFPVRVYYEDSDAAGIVYYANYLKFAERARSELCRLLGIDQRAMREEDGIVFAVRELAVDYRAPARLDDLLQVRSRLTALSGASLWIRQAIEREDSMLADLNVKLVCLRMADGRPMRLPAAVRTIFASLTQNCRNS